MEKLKLEHLAPYLAYETPIMPLYRSMSMGLGYNETILSIEVLHHFNIEDVKPILRPLSDLAKEIEHNVRRFIPIEWFEIRDDESENWFSFDHGNINLINDLNSISTHQVYHDINFLPYAVVQKLIEWHFDVFGLIEKGLAIDINTL